MAGETNLDKLLKEMKPSHQPGEYVFCSVQSLEGVAITDTVMLLKEEEGYTLILRKEVADHLSLSYTYIAAWITLTIHSSLEAVGLTAAFSKALAQENISCNVVAGYYHDHIFVDIKDAEKALKVLNNFAH